MAGGPLRYAIFETAAGFCGVAWGARGVRRVQLPASSADATERMLRRRAPGSVEAAPAPDVAATIAAMQDYFAGAEADFSGAVLDLDDEDAFFRQVYVATRQVGWGRTTTYGALARAVGAGPEAAREVGRAMARNPTPLLVPCHRVLAAGGRLGGFSAPGGSAAKARMLALEGVRLDSFPAAQALFEF